MTALEKIRTAGFELNLVGDSFAVKPASHLNQQQREFLKSHKAEIIGELRAEHTFFIIPSLGLIISLWGE
jgi:hypothetical protein